MKLMGARSLLGFAIALLALCGRAADPIAVFDQANRLYEQGKFAEAASTYQQLVAAGQVSPTIYYNLGNAWFKAGQPGRAVAAYRHAQELAPRDPNVRFNLNFVRQQVAGNMTPPMESWQRWLARLTVNEWTIVAAVLFWVWLLVLIVRELRPSPRSDLRALALITGIVALAAMAAVGLAVYFTTARREGVVIVPQTIVRLGPLEDSREYYQLRDGAEVLVLDEKRLSPNESWLQVRDSSRRVGWLKRDQLAIL
jgi:tetratricopeptide (TPR) repeat protein